MNLNVQLTITDLSGVISYGDVQKKDSATFENAVIQKWYGWRHVASAERVIEGDVMRSGFSAQVPEHMEGYRKEPSYF